MIAQDPGSALPLSDQLWEQVNLECRTLAASILGNLPAGYEDQTWERVQAWAKSEKDNQLLALLLDLGLAGIRRNATRAFLGQVESWLNSENLHEQRLALLAMVPLVEETGSEYLPTLFRLLSRLVRAVPMALRQDLLFVLSVMARHSPNETAYSLRQSLDSPLSLDTPWLIRRLLPDFPTDTQKGLREALRQVGR
jgi:hypothetical protein